MNRGRRILSINRDIHNEHVFHPAIVIFTILYKSIIRRGKSLEKKHSPLLTLRLHRHLPPQSQSPTLIHSDLLQRWLEDQLNLFRCQVKQTPPLSTRKTNRFSTNVILKTDSTDDESDTISENTFTTRANQSNPLPSKSASGGKRPHNHVRYKPLRKSSANTSHLIRHESLKYRNRPLLFDNHSSLSKTFHPYQSNHLKRYPHRTDSSSMPRSDLSDISSSRPDNLSESVISNLESEYDNIYTEPINSKSTVPMMSTSQILSDDDDDDDDDETTMATTVIAPTKSRCYF